MLSGDCFHRSVNQEAAKESICLTARPSLSALQSQASNVAGGAKAPSRQGFTREDLGLVFAERAMPSYAGTPTSISADPGG